MLMQFLGDRTLNMSPSLIVALLDCAHHNYVRDEGHAQQMMPAIPWRIEVHDLGSSTGARLLSSTSAHAHWLSFHRLYRRYGTCCPLAVIEGSRGQAKRWQACASACESVRCCCQAANSIASSCLPTAAKGPNSSTPVTLTMAYAATPYSARRTRCNNHCTACGVARPLCARRWE